MSQAAPRLLVDVRQRAVVVAAALASPHAAHSECSRKKPSSGRRRAFRKQAGSALTGSGAAHDWKRRLKMRRRRRTRPCAALSVQLAGQSSSAEALASTPSAPSSRKQGALCGCAWAPPPLDSGNGSYSRTSSALTQLPFEHLGEQLMT